MAIIIINIIIIKYARVYTILCALRVTMDEPIAMRCKLLGNYNVCHKIILYCNSGRFNFIQCLAFFSSIHFSICLVGAVVAAVTIAVLSLRHLKSVFFCFVFFSLSISAPFFISRQSSTQYEQRQIDYYKFKKIQLFSFSQRNCNEID